MAALQRLWLVPLALCAFWLAIENSYASFTAFKEEWQTLEVRTAKVVDQVRTISRTASSGAAAHKTEPSGSSGAAAAGLKLAEPAGAKVDPDAGAKLEASATAGPEANSEGASVTAAAQAAPTAGAREDKVKARVARERAELEVLRRQQEASRKRAEELKDDAVNLRVAGTEMPSRLSYAPTLWLAALLAWLLLFETYKLRTQRHLAAAVASYGDRKAPFGLAEETTLWLSPLPHQVSLRVSGDEPPEAVSREAMLTFLGSSLDEDRRNGRVAGLLWAGLGLLVARMAMLAAEMNGDFAASVRFTSPLARTLNPPITAFLAALCLLSLWRLWRRKSPRQDEGRLPGRRDAVVAAAATLGVLGLMANKAVLERWLGRASGGADRSSDRPGGGAFPRFLTAKRKQARARERRIVRRLANPGDVLVRRSRSKPGRPEPTLSFNGVDSEGTVRFYAFPRPTLQRIPPKVLRQVAARAGAPGAPHIAGAIHTVTFEAAALALIEQEKLIEACDILLAGCQISLTSNRPNLRLFDLLAGVAARYPAAAAYNSGLQELIRGSSHQPEPLKARMDRWKSSGWADRWTDSKPVLWGHPLQTEPPARRWWSLGGESGKPRPRRIVLKPAT